VAYEIKERSVGEILDGAFQIYRNHLGVFVGVALCVVVPSALAVSLVNWLVTGSFDPMALEAGSQGAPGSGGSPELARAMRSGLATTLTLPIQLFAGVLEDAVLTLTVADVYLGRPVSMRSGFRRSFAQLGALLGASLLKGIGIVIGFVCLIVPGILVMLRWLLSTQAIVIESHTGRGSLGRSRELTADNYGRLLLLMLVMTVIGMALHFGLQALLPDAVEHAPVLGPLLQQVPQILVAPVSSAALTLAYFDLRVRKEGFDLEHLARGLGGGMGEGLGGSIGESPVAPHGT
jgi:hypothetical protein